MNIPYLNRARTMAIAMFMGMNLQPLNAQVTTEVEWQRCLGGSGFEWGFSVAPMSDGGFVCIGRSDSNDGDAVGAHGSDDIMVVKLDADGAVLWRRMLGGSLGDYGYSCLEASDGSIMIAGSTNSTDGDVTMNQGQSDIWVLKLTPLGATIWQRTYGGSGNESGGQIQETPDGGFVINGTTNSADGDVVGYHPGGGLQDEWIFKISATGTLEWSRALGGSDIDVGGRTIQTTDGGFLLSFSYTKSTDGDVVNNHGAEDAWLVKVSTTGNIEWSLTIGGSELEFGFDILELSSGEFMFLGGTLSSDGDITVNQGGMDVLLARISSTGQLLWERTYGGTQDDDCRSLYPISDGGFILAGSSGSNDGDLTFNQGGRDIWVLKVDVNGSPVWQRSVGGTLDEWAFMYKGQSDYVLTGLTYSNDGAVQGNNGDRDLWLAQLDGEGDLRWQRCLGGSAEDWGYLRVQTLDGGYVAFGYTDSNDGDVSGNHGGRDMWVVKLKVTEPTVPPECALYIPNAFSPNNSTQNDSHCLYGTDCVTSMTFNIFDRWGNKVFASTDPKACWDGTYNGQALDPAVFVYHLSATLTDGETVERQGNITLLR